MAKPTNKSNNLLSFETLELKIENIQILMQFKLTPKKKKEIADKLVDLQISLINLKKNIYK